MIAKTPAAPYYAVIFSSYRTDGDSGYAEMAQRMEELASVQAGFLGVESAREELGITISYWENTEAISAWKENVDHMFAQKKGREAWYKSYKVRIAKVERDYDFEKID